MPSRSHIDIFADGNIKHVSPDGKKMRLDHFYIEWMDCLPDDVEELEIYQFMSLKPLIAKKRDDKIIFDVPVMTNIPPSLEKLTIVRSCVSGEYFRMPFDSTIKIEHLVYDTRQPMKGVNHQFVYHYPTN